MQADEYLNQRVQLAPTTAAAAAAQICIEITAAIDYWRRLFASAWIARRKWLGRVTHAYATAQARTLEQQVEFSFELELSAC